ncbi:MAG: hypothetical protein HOP30_22010 [Cyclobacteriaceae bacterium]|nr:hypothetical protein [Cyclobacteriaceae bacterium]
MEKNFDSGHSTNVARFAELVKRCIAFGSTFKPAKAIIKLDNLKIVLANAKQAMSALNTAHTDMTRAITERARTFGALDKMVTRLGSGAASSDILPETIEKINKQVAKYHSKRINPIDEPEPDTAAETTQEAETRRNSVAQGSMNRKIENFDKLITMFGAEENYQPNEMDLTVQSLKTMLNEVITRNDLAQDAKINFNAALEARDKILYDTELGLITCVRVTKKYVKFAFGPTSKEFKRLSSLTFKNKEEE